MSFKNKIQLNRLASGGAAMVISTVGIAMFNYALSLILSWSLSPAEYGQIGVSQAFIFICGWFLMSSFPWIIAKNIAQTGEGELADSYPFLKVMLWGNVGLALLMVFGLGLLMQFGTLSLDEAYRPLIRWVMLIIVLLGTRLVFDGVLQGTFAFVKLSIIRMVEVVIQFGTAVLLVWLGYGASGALAGFAAGSAISLLYIIWLTRHIPFWKTAGWSGFDLSQLRPALPLLIANLSGVLLVNIDVLALRFFANPAEADFLIGNYQAAAVLARIPYFVCQSLIAMIFPLVAQHAHERARANRHARQGLQFVIIILGLNILLISAPRPTILFFFPESYLNAVPVLGLLAFSMSMIILAQMLAAILQAQGHNLPAAILLPTAVFIQVIIAAWQIPQHGLIGAALGSCAAGAVALLTMLIAAHRLFPNLLQFSVGQFCKQAGALLILAIMGFALPYVASARFGVSLWMGFAVGLYVTILFVTQRPEGNKWTNLVLSEQP